jgi:hypothetical protein
MIIVLLFPPSYRYLAIRNDSRVGNAARKKEIETLLPFLVFADHFLFFPDVFYLWL